MTYCILPVPGGYKLSVVWFTGKSHVETFGSFEEALESAWSVQDSIR